MTMDRNDVYKAIDTEREYQDALSRNEVNRPGSPMDNIAILDSIISKMKEEFYSQPGYPSMDGYRKIAATAVRVMEKHGVEDRQPKKTKKQSRLFNPAYRTNKKENDMAIETDKYMWWCGMHDDHFDAQYDTREDAIKYGRSEYDGLGDGFYICEAVTPSVKISDYLDFELLLEHANEQCYDNHGDPDGDGDMISVSKEQELALGKSIRECVDKWQTENKISVSAWQFINSRNEEYISMT